MESSLGRNDGLPPHGTGEVDPCSSDDTVELCVPVVTCVPLSHSPPLWLLHIPPLNFSDVHPRHILFLKQSPHCLAWLLLVLLYPLLSCPLPACACCRSLLSQYIVAEPACMEGAREFSAILCT